MKKHALLVVALAVAAAALLALGACTAVPSSPAATATTAPAAATPAAPATAAVQTTVQAPVSATVPAPVEGQRPLAQIPAEQRNDMFSGPAAQYVQANTIYIATIVTDKGNIVAELYQDTPLGLNNFVTLALDGFYDGLTFHRVEPGFVVQGGDPLGTGGGGPGYEIDAEINYPHPRGALAWARTSDDINPDRMSSGSQFYITLAQTEFLDNQYSVFGYVIEGMDVVDQIAAGDKIQRVDITTATTTKLPTPYPTATPTTAPTPTITPTPFAPASQEGRPLASVEVAKRDKYFNTAPAMTIDTTKKYEATIETAKGNIVMELDPALAPVTVNNFVTLANLGYFDNMPVAHVEPTVYAVFGSPLGRPDSDVGYSLASEVSAQSSQLVTGTVAMYPIYTETGDVTASGSQFFFSFALVPEGGVQLNVMGTVTSGLEIAQSLIGMDAQATVNAQGTPEAVPTPDVIKTITIKEK